MKFEEIGLSKPLLDALHSMGFSAPTPIQEQAIPLLLKGHDLIGQAQTGTGKTAAFGLPILEAWLKGSLVRTHSTASNSPAHAHSGAPHSPAGHSHTAHSSAPLSSHVSRSGAHYNSRAPPPVYAPRVAMPSALILVPTRELAVQVHESLQAMAQHTRARIVPIYGGVEMRKQLRYFNSQVDILVGTPGRTLDHMRQGSIKLSNVRMVVLDEADRMLDMGFVHDVTKILDQTPTQRQTLLFSATMSPEVRRIAQKYLRNAESVKVSEDTLTVDGITQLYVRVDSSNRLGMLLAAIRTLKPFLSLVFTRTKHDAKKLARLLAMNGVNADALHGNLRQNARERAMASLRAGKIDVMVATDIASRGIDVREITHVFNYELPDDPMTYVHRIGRTGRAGAKGVAVSFISGSPQRAIGIIQDATGSRMEELVLTPEPVKLPERMEYRRGDVDHPGQRGREGGSREGGYGRSHGGRGGRHEGVPSRHEGGSYGGSGRSNAERSSHRQGSSNSHHSRNSGPRPPPGAHHHSSHKRY